LQQFGVESFDLLSEFLLILKGCLSFRCFLLQFLHLILYARNVQHGLHLLPQFPPWPQAQLHVLAQVALYHLEGNPLFLQLLVFLSGLVTSDPCLEPGHDLGQTVVTELLHLTQDTSPEEHLGMTHTVLLSVHVYNVQNHLSDFLRVVTSFISLSWS